MHKVTLNVKKCSACGKAHPIVYKQLGAKYYTAVCKNTGREIVASKETMNAIAKQEAGPSVEGDRRARAH